MWQTCLPEGRGVAQRVHIHWLLDSGFLFGFIHRPLHTPLGITGIKISTYPALDLLIFAVEYPFIGLFCFQVGFQSADQNIGQRDVTVFLAFSFL